MIDDVVEIAKVFVGPMRVSQIPGGAMTARLVCTCRGAGAQYGVSTDGADPRRVFSVPAGAPIVLRGSLWLGQPRSDVLRRTPPIEGAGAARLALALDPFDRPAGL